MQLADGSHLTYCTNIHPGEDWQSLLSQLKAHLPEVKKRISPDQPLGVGLRLSGIASGYLANNSEALEQFKHWLEEQGIYVFTLNGFPYGEFHNRPVKEQVYQPDWRSEERFAYSCRLAKILATLLPEGMTGSISTVPVGFKPNFATQMQVETAAQNILRFTKYLIEYKKQRGAHIQLALEPEPGCYLETTAGTILFFERQLLDKTPIRPEILTQHLGVCLDTCHAAVMFENSLEAAQAYQRANIPLHKIQLTTAVQASALNAESKQQLQQFCDDVYLHQSCVRSNGRQKFYLDLPEALENSQDGDELRSHFHVPVFHERLNGLQTTQADLLALLETQKQQALSQHLEVETYSFDVLPEHLRKDSVVDNISRELLWTREQLA